MNVSVMAPRKRQIARGALDLLTGLPVFATAPLYRHWHMRWGATDEEVCAPMAGDRIVPEAPFNATRAITIEAPPGRVWPWIVQMGYGRAGFYTYDLVDNGGYPSTDDVLEQYQDIAVGDWAFNMNSLFGKELPLDESNAFKVSGFEIDEWLLWEKPDSTWSWLLKPIPGGKTRLIVRTQGICSGRSSWSSATLRWREGCSRALSPERRRTGTSGCCHRGTPDRSTGLGSR